MDKSCDNCSEELCGIGPCENGHTLWTPKGFFIPEKDSIEIHQIPSHSIKIKAKLMSTTDPIFLPSRKYPNDAGADLRARIKMPILLHPQRIVKIPTGVGIEIPPGYVGLIQPRSGASSEGKLVITGTIDSNYRGEITMTVFNPLDSNYVVIKPGERIAQLVIVPYMLAEFEQVDKLSESDRGINGFGSTGKD